jgi:uncharacterized protein (TIGR02646 family)
MRWIDYENKLPTDNDIPGWTPWTQEQWEAWLAKSEELKQELAELEAAGRRDDRNKLIDKNSSHWGKLKEWLLALSGKKCWFSDTINLYAHYDVEHFRPKKEAKSFDGSPRDGYWWLAFDYANFRICGNVGNRKKGGWFPLRAGSLRSTYDNPCEESEEPYFIDPIKRADVNLIGFDEEGKLIPWPNASEWDALRVKETAERLKLNEHKDLAEERRKLLQYIIQLLHKFELATARCAKGNNPGAKQKADEIARRIEEVISSGTNLSSVARCYLAMSNDTKYTRFLR